MSHVIFVIQLELSWFGSDEESGIHTYEVGLSSTGSEDMDLLPYTSTHGHRHFITYHSNLMDGETFYVHIKAVNRAGSQTVQVMYKLWCFWLYYVGPNCNITGVVDISICRLVLTFIFTTIIYFH